MPGIIPPGHPQALPTGSSLLPSGVKAALLNMLTLGAYQHPADAKAYWSDLGHELDPRTPQGLVALGATIFGPRLDDPAITTLRGTNGELVPLPRGMKAAQRVTSNPGRNLQHDFARDAVARAIRARESEPVARHIESVAKRASIQDTPENVHDLLENNDTTRGEPHAPPRVLRETLRPNQQALLRFLLARERLA